MIFILIFKAVFLLVFFEEFIHMLLKWAIRKRGRSSYRVDRALWLLPESETEGCIKLDPLPTGFISAKNKTATNPCLSQNNATKKSKEKEIKEKETEEENAPRPSDESAELAASATASKTCSYSDTSSVDNCYGQSRETLCQTYGEPAVSEYEKRFEKWRADKGAVKADKYRCIGRWMENDRVLPKPRQTFSSLKDSDDIMSEVMRQYQCCS